MTSPPDTKAQGDKSDTKQVLKVDIQEARAAVFTLRRHNHEAGAIAVDGVCNSHSALVAENERLKGALNEAWDLLNIARRALMKMGLDGCGDDALPHETRMFAMHFSPDEVLQLPGGTKRTGDGRLDEWRKACSAALTPKASI